MPLEWFDDARAFLDRAADHLAADPVLSTVVAGVAARLAARSGRGDPEAPSVPQWWVVAADGDAVTGVGMRTMTTVPYTAYLLPMPDDDARALAGAVHARGERLSHVNGALPAARVCAEELARLTGGAVRAARPTRLHELGTLVPPKPSPGRLRVADETDLDLVGAWLERFHDEADAQAGRAPEPSGSLTRAEVRERVAAGLFRLWVRPSGEIVHLTGVSPPQFGVARLGPVYTPAAHRGRGYAGAAVAQASADLLAQGARVCLFTDLDNPTSNALYERLGFVAVADTAEFVVASPG